MPKEALEQIFEIVKKNYGDCIAVDIHINCEGITCKAAEMPFTIDKAMMTINGEWLERRVSEN